MEHIHHTSEKLNKLLSSYSVFYQNTRGFHWNVQGPKFFELHAKFEELYNDLQETVDEIAERILMLGETPLHRMSDYLKHSNIEETGNLFEGSRIVENIVRSIEIILTQEREILNLSAEYNDEGTNNLMSDYILKKEKLNWMYSAFLSRRPNFNTLSKSA